MASEVEAIVNDKTATFLISSLVGGGAEGVCVNVANGLAEMGWEINLVVLHLNNAAYVDRLSDRVKLHVLEVKHARNAFFSLRKYILLNKPKKVLVFNYELAVLMVLLRSLFRYQFKLLARNINTMSAKREQAKRASFWRRCIVSPLIDSFYSQADHVVNQCKAMDQDLIRVYPQLKGRTSVIYNPIAKPLEDYSSFTDLTKNKKDNYFLCVGRLEEQKAFHYAIKAFSELLKIQPKMRLKIVGQGSLELELKQFAIDLNVADSVDFEGFQKDMVPFYTKARATVLTSLYEGFPNVLVESISLGTPVIAFDCPSGPSEIIQNGVNGYLVKYLDEIDLLDKLYKVCDKPLAAHSVLSTKNSFRTGVILNKYDKLLNEVFL